MPESTIFSNLVRKCGKHCQTDKKGIAKSPSRSDNSGSQSRQILYTIEVGAGIYQFETLVAAGITNASTHSGGILLEPARLNW